MTSMGNRWYADGLRFQCTQCGACCSGAPGFVWVDEVEIERMAQALKMSDEDFRDKFVRRVGARFSLVEYPDGDCIFLDPDSRGCLVYEARPTQCRTWPFWSSNLKSAKTWKETCQACPGAGTGQLYPLEAIEHARQQKHV